jgi:prepilin-type N-terminal cleavage/methylation domain-containing protein
MNTRNPGFTLVEMLVVTVLAAVALGAVYQTLAVQERNSRQQTAIIQSHQTNRAVLHLLAAELREISSRGDDILEATADEITIRASRKLGFVCEVDPALRVRTLGDPFAKDDEIFIFADGEPETRTDDDWVHARVTGVSNNSPCLPQWNAADNLSQDLTLNILEGSLAAVLPGAPVRAVTTITYKIAEIDGQWVLAREIPGRPADAMIGPLLSRAEGGLEFAYFDQAGGPVAPGAAPVELAKISRIRVLVQGTFRMGVGGQLDYAEPLVTDISLRGN